MKKTASLIVSIFILVNMFSVLNVTAESGANIKWSIEDGVLTVWGDGAIADYYNSLPWSEAETLPPWKRDIKIDLSHMAQVETIIIGDDITRIGDAAFSEYPNVKKVVIGKNVTEIGDFSFYYCPEIEEIEISGKVKSVGQSAFYACFGLKKVSIGKHVESIQNHTFDSCYKLSEITVDNENESFSSQAGVLFNNDKTLLIKYPGGKINRSYKIPEEVTEIATAAFEYTEKLENVIFPEGMIKIGEYAFEGCEGIEKVSLPDSVREIAGAFSKCSNLKSVKLGDGIEVIGGAAFAETSLENIELPETVVEIGNAAFYETNLKSIVIPDSVKTIRARAFQFCYDLYEITIGDNVEHIGEEAFSETGYFYRYDEVENNGFYIEKYLLSGGCVDGKAKFKDGTVLIADGAFENCYYMFEVEIPDGVKFIGDRAFADCRIYGTLKIGKGVEHIGKNVFMGCSIIENIEVDAENKHFTSVDGVLFTKDKKTILYRPVGKEEFEYAVPDGVEVIAEGAFNNSERLIKITLPDSVTEIGENAFEGCKLLEYVQIGDDVEVIADNLFRNLKSLKMVILGNGVEKIGDDVFYGCEELKKVVIPKSVTSIGNWIFAQSNNVTDVYYGGSEEEWSSLSQSGTWNLPKNVIIHYNFKGAEDLVSVTVSGNSVNFLPYGQQPVIVNNRVLVPLRAVAEMLGADVEWNNDKNCVEMSYRGTEITLKADTTVVYINGVAETTETPIKIINDRIMVPVRAISEAFGCTVNWNDVTKTVEIAQ